MDFIGIIKVKNLPNNLHIKIKVMNFFIHDFFLLNDDTFIFDGVLRGNHTNGVIEILRNDHVSGTLWLTNYNGDIKYNIYLGTDEPN